MYCEKCGTELTDEMVKCPKCGNEVKKEESNSEQSENKIDIKKLKRMIKSNIRYVYYILAVLIFFMFMIAASNISTYGVNISNIESIGGKTLEEAYYYELGGIYAGYATVVRGIGIFISAVLVWLGANFKKENKDEKMS